MVEGAFLSATVESLLHKLASSEFTDYIKYSELNILKLTVFVTTLLTLRSVLHDAEQKQFFNPKIKQWMNELYDAISVSEDLLDEIGYDSLRCKVENTPPESGFMFDDQMRIVCQRLQGFVRPIDALGLRPVSGWVSGSNTSSVVNESVIIGREEDKERLMSMLVSGNDNDKKLGVVAILGDGGVGKSTLARLVYNDKKVDEHFDLKVWVCVTEDFDICRITKALLESVSSTIAYEGNDLDHVRVHLKGGLMRKRILFVLDGLWNDSYNDWHELIDPLVNGNCGSRVIITTRYERVAEVAHTYPIHKLEPLSDEHCWSLLSKYAFGSDDIKYPILEAIGKKIAKKCGGLPIAAKTLGGLLSSKLDANEWTAILNSNIWNIPNNNILPALLLSYLYLPSHLKRCSVYCSISPKGYPLEKKHLILLWMAEGFLEHSMVGKVEEEVGDDFFIELFSRSLIEQFKDDL